ncbi:putative membrane protein YdjX (TVP38/TMEM64 family) [Trichococcus patagoniensis]|uniref:TVP38/TMEM64 family membrane protein n=2 Tax=Trichococcus patagoniensis TaxID=382641 RepID=A0A2T5I9Z5_9LACT|nr:putative membrane protein YdjX (TVP38/TMEM64 family) [Trichococcus patagoniensis]
MDAKKMTVSSKESAIVGSKSLSAQDWLFKNKNSISIIGGMLSIGFIIYGWNLGIFTSGVKMAAWLGHYGIVTAPLLFILVQVIQVVVPIIPGALGCVLGIAMFGPINGFIYNYIGICLGSIIAFLLGRAYGPDFIRKVTGDKFYDRYSKYLDSDHGFDKMLAVLIFLPVAPDDLLCYLSGISTISVKKFSAIIVLAKPFSIFLYSMGLSTVMQALIK